MTDQPSAESQAKEYFVPFPPIEQLAVVGDRRTSATIAADGTVSWMCLPRFDGRSLFGCLLDLDKGGYWRLGPEDRDFGVQTYLPGTAVLQTRWEQPDSVLETIDAMLWPEDARPAGLEPRRVLLRRLQCLSGRRRVSMRIEPSEDFSAPACAQPIEGGVRLQTPCFDLALWCSHPLEILPGSVGAQLMVELSEGEELWAVLDSAPGNGDWNPALAREALGAAIAFWRDWSARLECAGERADQIRFSAVVAYLFTYAPTGAPIAAPTAALPERVPGEYNYDYRYCWIRDGSLTMSLLAELGAIEPVGRFLDWVAGLPGGSSGMPLQVFYRIDGGLRTPGTKRPDVSGYRDCQPVQFGNPVYQMEEIDGFGYLADCALIYAQQGGVITDAHWALLSRCADFVVHHWDKPTAGIWELMPMQHFVVSKVMCWVTLDRTLQLAARLGRKPAASWRREQAKIHADVMKNGWDGKVNSFVQRYDSDALDGSLLLIPLMGFLPPKHERITATVERVSAVLRLNGLVHRFVPKQTPGRPDEPMGDKEGAFLMCSFWLAQTWHLLGRAELAESTLRRAESCRGTSGLFSEAADARHTPGLLGNMPLLFSQVEYARAARALGEKPPARDRADQ